MEKLPNVDTVAVASILAVLVVFGVYAAVGYVAVVICILVSVPSCRTYVLSSSALALMCTEPTPHVYSPPNTIVFSRSRQSSVASHHMGMSKRTFASVKPPVATSNLQTPSMSSRSEYCPPRSVSPGASSLLPGKFPIVCLRPPSCPVLSPRHTNMVCRPSPINMSPPKNRFLARLEGGGKARLPLQQATPATLSPSKSPRISTLDTSPRLQHLFWPIDSSNALTPSPAVSVSRTVASSLGQTVANCVRKRQPSITPNLNVCKKFKTNEIDSSYSSTRRLEKKQKRKRKSVQQTPPKVVTAEDPPLLKLPRRETQKTPDTKSSSGDISGKHSRSPSQPCSPPSTLPNLAAPPRMEAIKRDQQAMQARLKTLLDGIKDVFEAKARKNQLASNVAGSLASNVRTKPANTLAKHAPLVHEASQLGNFFSSTETTTTITTTSCASANGLLVSSSPVMTSASFGVSTSKGNELSSKTSSNFPTFSSPTFTLGASLASPTSIAQLPVTSTSVTISGNFNFPAASSTSSAIVSSLHSTSAVGGAQSSDVKTNNSFLPSTSSPSLNSFFSPAPLPNTQESGAFSIASASGFPTFSTPTSKLPPSSPSQQIFTFGTGAPSTSSTSNGSSGFMVNGFNPTAPSLWTSPAATTTASGGSLAAGTVVKSLFSSAPTAFTTSAAPLSTLSSPALISKSNTPSSNSFLTLGSVISGQQGNTNVTSVSPSTLLFHVGTAKTKALLEAPITQAQSSKASSFAASPAFNMFAVPPVSKPIPGTQQFNLSVRNGNM